MLGSDRFAKTIATSLCAAFAAYAVAAGLAEKDAHAQISGTIGGDAAGRQLLEDEGIFFEAAPSGSVLVTAEELANAWMDGTSNTIMVGYTSFLPDGTPVSDHSVAIAVALLGVRRPPTKTDRWRAAVGIAVVSWMISLGSGAQARLVAKGDDQTTDSGTAPTALDCSLDQNSSCIYNRGGSPAYENGVCVCYVSVWVPRQVTNAEKGDVGLVPIAGNNGGDPVVRAALGSLGQAHRHSVMFYSNGQMIRHNTMYTDEIEVKEPLVGKVSLDAARS